MTRPELVATATLVNAQPTRHLHLDRTAASCIAEGCEGQNCPATYASGGMTVRRRA
jgi:hypothetical protein